jgi:hypothetical protein
MKSAHCFPNAPNPRRLASGPILGAVIYIRNHAGRRADRD